MRVLAVIVGLFLAAPSLAAGNDQVSETFSQRSLVGDYEGKRNFLLYSSDCDETIAGECGILKFECGENRWEHQITLLSVEPYEFADMLKKAASVLPQDMESSQLSGQTGLPGDALQIRTDQGSAEISYIDNISAVYGHQYGFWQVGVRTDFVSSAPQFIDGARWLRLSLLDYEVTVTDAAILQRLHQFIASCPLE